MIKSIEEQMPLVCYPSLSAMKELGIRDREVGMYTAGHDSGAEAQRSSDAKWIEEQGYVKLPSEEWLTEFFKPIENNRCDADDVAQALIKALKEAQ